MKAVFGVRTVLVLIGFTAAIAQVVLLRELLVVFYGNESSLGLMLGSWLFWTAAGSSLAGRLAARGAPVGASDVLAAIPEAIRTVAAGDQP